MESDAGSARLYRVIDALADIVGEDLVPDAVLTLIARKAAELVHADASTISVPDAGKLLHKAATETMTDLVGSRVDIERSFSGRCLLAGDALVCDDTENDSRVDRERCRAVGVRCMVAVPLLHRSRVVGVLKVMSSRPVSFSADDVRVLSILARFAAPHINHASEVERLSQSSTVDALTGLDNRRAFDARMTREFASLERYGVPMTLVLLDIDRFKALNDRYGHLVGDEALTEIGAIMREQIRACDGAYRIGGDEFAMIMPQTSLAGATLVVTRVQASIVSMPASRQLLNVSYGIGEADGEDAASLFARTDAALYQMKRARRSPSTGQLVVGYQALA